MATANSCRVKSPKVNRKETNLFYDLTQTIQGKLKMFEYDIFLFVNQAFRYYICVGNTTMDDSQNASFCPSNAPVKIFKKETLIHLPNDIENILN